MIESLKRMADMNLWREQKYSNERALHLIGWTQSLSHAPYKYVKIVLGTGVRIEE